MSLSDYIKRDEVFAVPYDDGELKLSVAYDVVHRFAPLGATMLKYWDADNTRFCNVLITNESGDFLVGRLGLMEVMRPSITQSEHQLVVEYEAENLNDLDFGF